MTEIPDAAGPDPKASIAGKIMLVGSIIVIAGLILPWVSVSFDAIPNVPAGALPSSSENGIGTTDGKYTLIFASIAAVLGLLLSQRNGKAKGLGIAGIVFGALIALAAVIDIATLKKDALKGFLQGFKGAGGAQEQANVFADALNVSTGVGLYLALAGGLIIVIGAVMGLGVTNQPAESWTAAQPPMQPPAPPAPPLGETPMAPQPPAEQEMPSAPAPPPTTPQ